MSRPKLLALQLLVALAAVLIWQLFTTVPIGGVKLLPPFFFSTPTDVAARIVKWFVEGTIWKHLWITLVESVLAFVIGSVAGVLIGFWFAQQPRVAAVFDTYSFSIPHPPASPAGLTRASITLRKNFLRRGWIAGSSPAMTKWVKTTGMPD